MRILKISFGVFLTLVIISLPLMLPRIIEVGATSCSSQFGPCGESLSEKIEVAKGKNLYEAEGYLSETLSKEILVRNFSTQFKLPGTLEVNVVLRKPQSAIYDSQKNVFGLVDKDGYLVEITQTTVFPKLSGEVKIPNVGESVDSHTFFALEILTGLHSLYQVNEAILTKESLVVEFEGGPAVIFPVDGEKDALLGGLRLILEGIDSGKITVNDRPPDVIDLRFKNPILK